MSYLDIALDLGKAIKETSEYKKMQSAEQAVAQDKVASKVIKDFDDLQNAYQRMQMMGNKIEEKHIQKLKEAYEKMMANELVNKFENARAAFHNLLSEVNDKISEGMGRPRQKDSCSASG